VSRLREKRGTHRLFVGKPMCQRALGKPSLRWDHNIENDREAVRGDTDWIDMAQGRNMYWAV